ncbi:TetR/AcrR family transcriptional regulator [Gordonia zhaorongruii]|uniref:TetR/AcrR family transcriptional regulator n=1 Tax=Gordonia zhaorongruii TaxID=2597659 RepID=UPI00104D881A|nr:TetR/AcrR family transcriptional regulator [Gordonia zhaorongruii]
MQDDVVSPGRPSDPDIDARVAEATLRLLTANGFHALSISGVATAAGVPRSTVYRRGDTPAALAVAAVSRTVPSVREFHTSDPLTDLSACAEDFIMRFIADPSAAVVMELHACAYNDPDLAALVRDYLRPRGDVIDAIASRAVASGAVDPGLDSGMVRDLVFGPLMYRWLVAKAPLDPPTVRTVVAASIRGITPR